MVRLRYRLIGDPVFKFRAGLERFAGPEIDGIHKQVAVRLTTAAKQNLEARQDRPWESGNRRGHRLTGVLTGKHGHKAAIQSRIINRGGEAQAKGVGFPDLTELDRRAKHWRGLEYGWPYMTMPTGLFIRDGSPQPLRARTSGDTFIMYGEWARRARALGEPGTKAARGPLGPIGQRRTRFEAGRRSRAEGGRGVVRQRGRVRGIEGRRFLERAWNDVAGPRGEKIIEQYEKKLKEIFGEFTR